MTHLKNCPKYVYFSREFHTFPVTEGNEIRHIYFQFMTPARKLTHNTKFKHFLDAERHEFWECHNSSLPWARETPKSDPERHEFRERHNSSLPWARESPKSNPERQEFQETALIDPSKKCQQIRKVFIFPEFRTIIEMHSLTQSTLTNQSLWEHLVAHFLRLQTNCDIFGQ